MDFNRPLRVLAPTLDADVLAVLARADTEMTGREIQRLTGRGSHQGVRNAAERLVGEGIVARRAAGNAHLYRLNREHVAAGLIEDLAGLPDRVIEKLREAIAGWSRPPLLAMLFGSIATGRSTAASDVDLLIVRPMGVDPDSGAWTRQLADLQRQATAWSGNDTRILEYGEQELPRSTAEPVLREAAREGIELYGSRRVLHKGDRPPGRSR